jgi:hypothetical protein
VADTSHPRVRAMLLSNIRADRVRRVSDQKDPTTVPRGQQRTPRRPKTNVIVFRGNSGAADAGVKPPMPMRPCTRRRRLAARCLRTVDRTPSAPGGTRGDSCRPRRSQPTRSIASLKPTVWPRWSGHALTRDSSFEHTCGERADMKQLPPLIVAATCVCVWGYCLGTPLSGQAPMV